MVMWQLFCKIHIYQVTMLYTLNSHGVKICQLYLYKAGYKKKRKEETKEGTNTNKEMQFT